MYSSIYKQFNLEEDRGIKIAAIASVKLAKYAKCPSTGHEHINSTLAINWLKQNEDLVIDSNNIQEVKFLYYWLGLLMETYQYWDWVFRAIETNDEVDATLELYRGLKNVLDEARSPMN